MSVRCVILVLLIRIFEDFGFYYFFMVSNVLPGLLGFIVLLLP